MKIYLDVLMITNAIISMMCIQLTAKLCRRKVKNKRLLLSSIIGAMTSLLIMFSGGSYGQSLLLTAVKIISFPIMVAAAMPVESFRELLRKTIVFFLTNLTFAGLTLIIWQISDSKIIFIRNYTVYFNISLSGLIIAVGLCYGVISVYELIRKKWTVQDRKYTATFRCGNYQLTIPALSDTGNKLCDSFTGTPVIVFYCNDLFYHYNLDNDSFSLTQGFRFIPFSTVSGKGLIPITAMGDVEISDGENLFRQLRCCVGVVKSEQYKAKAIFNPQILQ